uniref:Putative methyltransferase n=1 Tax=viral metagenome TaxID=1070528 RepID=A0A6M3K9J9_9ZZZZ
MKKTKPKRYQAVKIPAGVSLNRILDNEARELYKPSIDKLMELVPEAMARKIPEANVQQGFVFDTVHRYTVRGKIPKVLCVGSYEDTASMGLIAMGYRVTEIDPVINCPIQKFFVNPSTVRNSYDIIFSTSVIEHVQDDSAFVAYISELLAPNGVAIITCDYKDGWMPGEPKPPVDMRLYTQGDLRDRLLFLMTGCSLVDEPQWDCPNPDFILAGTYQYTFATLVAKKN